MTPDEHQRERMRLWSTSYTGNFVDGHPPGRCCDFADAAVAEFDKRFPAPAAVEPVPAEPPMLFARTLAAMEERDAAAELATLRTKARYWDAVATPQTIRLHQYADGPWFCTWMRGMGTKTTGPQESAAEAVQAAIDAGALK